MPASTLAHLSDSALARALAAVVAQERTATAAVLAHLAEFDARRLYLPAGFPSMHSYCVRELRLSECAATNVSRRHAPRGRSHPSSMPWRMAACTWRRSFCSGLI